MAEKLKVWAVVNESNEIVETYETEQEAIEQVEMWKLFSVKKLVEKEPELKFVMNEAQFKELIKLNEKPRLNVYGALSMVLESVDFVNLRKIVNSCSNVAQARFAVLWTQLEETDPLELIEVLKPKKYIVVSKADGRKYYVNVSENHVVPTYTDARSLATSFDTKEEAELWLNPKVKIIEDERD